jgi:hypothetical protein
MTVAPKRLIGVQAVGPSEAIQMSEKASSRTLASLIVQIHPSGRQILPGRLKSTNRLPAPGGDFMVEVSPPWNSPRS